MPSLLVQITEEQAEWLNSKCDRFNPKSRLIRDLIDEARFKADKPAQSRPRLRQAPRD